MIKLRYTILLTIFVSCVLAVQQVSAQAEPAPAGNEISPLKVGDKIPDALWDEYFPIVSAASEQQQLLSLGDFKDKLIILDFWATWCGSCIAAMPKLHDIAEEFKEEVMVIPVTMEGEEKVRPFLNSNENVKPLGIESIVKGETLKDYFPHRMIPHLAVIQHGSVVAITSAEQLSKDVIAGMLDGKQTKLRTKADRIDFDRNNILLRDDSLIRESLIYGSSFFSHLNGVGSYHGVRTDRGYTRFFLINQTIQEFYFAVIEPRMRNRVFFEVADKRRIHPAKSDDNDLEGWFMENSYSYELISPEGTALSKMKPVALTEFDRHFGFRSGQARRDLECYVIRNKKGGQKAISQESLADSAGQVKFEKLIDYLNYQMAVPERRPIFLNESDIDIATDILLGDYDYRELTDLQKILEPYGLEVSSEKRSVQIFLIQEQ